ncbi:amino acid ABC transporter ATP-binding protein [bacterium]|nr:amino acid ABC transporter ATP-binding protein [bacterium]
MLKIKNICKTIRKKRILYNISAIVRPGEIALFIGQTGSGKSMFLRTLNNLEEKDSGFVYLNDEKLQNIPGKKLKIGMVFEKFNLFENMTVERNISFVLENMKTPKKIAQKLALQLLKKYHLLDSANDMASSLSSGQKQLLAIARTVSLKPPVITFDKPTSALDPLLTVHIANIIQNLAKEGFIVLVTTHDPMLLKNLNGTIYFLEKGQIIEKATSKTKRFYPLINKFICGKK